jgi:hypothetical protein
MNRNDCNEVINHLLVSATGDIPIAVANAILMSAILVSNLFAVFVFFEYGKLDIISWPYGLVLIAVITFVVAIFIELFFVF